MASGFIQPCGSGPYPAGCKLTAAQPRCYAHGDGRAHMPVGTLGQCPRPSVRAAQPHNLWGWAFVRAERRVCKNSGGGGGGGSAERSWRGRFCRPLLFAKGLRAACIPGPCMRSAAAPCRAFAGPLFPFRQSRANRTLPGGSSSQSPLYSGGFLAVGEKAAVASLPCSASPQKAVAAAPLLSCKRLRHASPCFGPFAAAEAQ